MADYSRFWIMAVTLDNDGNYKSMERFAPDYHPVQPLDINLVHLAIFTYWNTVATPLDPLRNLD